MSEFDMLILERLLAYRYRNGVNAVGFFKPDIPVPVLTADHGAVPLQLHDQREK